MRKIEKLVGNAANAARTSLGDRLLRDAPRIPNMPDPMPGNIPDPMPGINAPRIPNIPDPMPGINAPRMSNPIEYKRMQPTVEKGGLRSAVMRSQEPLGGLRSAVKTAATNVKTAIEKQPALQKPAIGAALQKKPVGRVVGGLANKFLKRR